MRTFRYLLYSMRANVAVVLGFMAVVVGGTALFTGGKSGEYNLFTSYYSAFPALSLLFLFIFAFAVCTSDLNIALSFGGRRREFFAALQGLFGVYTLFFWAIQLLMAAIPAHLGWDTAENWKSIITLGGQPWWVFPLVCLATLSLGGVCGLAFSRSRVVGIIIVCLSATVGVCAALGTILIFSTDRIHLWGSLPAILMAAMVVILGASEYYIWRHVSRAVVK